MSDNNQLQELYDKRDKLKSKIEIERAERSHLGNMGRVQEVIISQERENRLKDEINEINEKIAKFESSQNGGMVSIGGSKHQDFINGINDQAIVNDVLQGFGLDPNGNQNVEVIKSTMVRVTEDLEDGYQNIQQYSNDTIEQIQFNNGQKVQNDKNAQIKFILQELKDGVEISNAVKEINVSLNDVEQWYIDGKNGRGVENIGFYNEVKQIESFVDYTEKEILKYAAMGEKYSNHPIAKSIIKANQENLEEVQEFQEIAGKGLSYQYNGKNVLIGNSQLIGIQEKNEITKIYVKIDEEIVGTISLGDTIKEGTKEVIHQLKSLGIKTSMFTGDNKNIADKIAKEIGIENVKSEMLPQDKYTELEKMLGKMKKVAFVGDGINDSPVLARADVGISMGGVGSESAIEASDVVIMTDNISKIIEAIKISKKTCGIIKQNLVFSISVKIIVLILSGFGIGGMWQAVFADVGVTIITVFNTLRILK